MEKPKQTFWPTQQFHVISYPSKERGWEKNYIYFKEQIKNAQSQFF